MKTNLKKAALLITGTLLGGSVFAQTPDSLGNEYVKPFSSIDSYRTWSIGVGVGVLTPYTMFKGNHEDFIYHGTDLGYNVYIKDQLLPSFGVQLSYLGGKISGAGGENPAFSSYSTKLKYAIDLSGNFTFANISWQNKKNAIQPYLTAGFGLTAYQPTFVANGTSIKVDHNIKNGYIPVGLGLKFNLSPALNLDLGYQVNFVDGDNLDAFNYGPSNDKFSYAHVGLEFSLGAASKPQLATHNPVASMRHEYLLDELRLQAQVDAQKAQNDQLRNEMNATKADLDAKLAKFTADSDGDGVPDFFDKCPGTPAGTKVDGAGCPLPVAAPAKDVKVYVTEEDRKVVRDAIKNLEFDFGKATIRAHSYPSLERVANLLVNKNFSLKLAGHTDNVGSTEANLKLSKDRAESVKAVLVGKGANPSRIEATGYGKAQPIATNKTAKGRQLNRRVEFTLY
ncbi:MAG: flagellar motor protein MotB [Mucilaginibacter sp.]|jgi:OOP family OmpA-OmpF porin|nr:flagellar motor protein MotB [Mucilaginibacter sp.]